MTEPHTDPKQLLPDKLNSSNVSYVTYRYKKSTYPADRYETPDYISNSSVNLSESKRSNPKAKFITKAPGEVLKLKHAYTGLRDQLAQKDAEN